MDQNIPSTSELVISNPLEFDHYKLRGEFHQLQNKVIELEKSKNDYESDLRVRNQLIANQSKIIKETSAKLVECEIYVKDSKTAIAQLSELFQTQVELDAEKFNSMNQELISLRSGLQNSTTSIENMQRQILDLIHQLEASKSANAEMKELFVKQINAMQRELNKLKSETQGHSATSHPSTSQLPPQTLSDAIMFVERGEKTLAEKRKLGQSTEEQFATAVKTRNINDSSCQRDENKESSEASSKSQDVGCGDEFQNGGHRSELGSQLNSGRTLKCSVFGCGMRFPNGKSFAEHIRKFHN